MANTKILSTMLGIHLPRTAVKLCKNIGKYSQKASHKYVNIFPRNVIFVLLQTTLNMRETVNILRNISVFSLSKSDKIYQPFHVKTCQFAVCPPLPHLPPPTSKASISLLSPTQRKS